MNRVSKLVLSLTLVFPVLAQAQLFSAMAPPSKQKGVLSYSGSIQPETSLKDSSENASMNRGTVIATVPVYKTDEEAWAITTLGNWLDLYPDQNSIMPDLYQVDVGVTYSRMINEKKYWAANVNFGSASDKPFKDPSVNTIGANYFYVNPVDETATWIYLVNYSNNRPILNNIPIPGFAYMYTPSKTFRGTFGAPFAQIYWEFVDRWSLNFFTLIPWVIKSSVDYSIAGPMKVALGLDFSQSTYYIFGRENRQDRLFYDEKRLFLGFKSPLSKTFMFEAEAGYAFDRRYFSAENYEPNPSNAVGLGTSPYVKLNITAFMF
ncbi:hypothetical protein ACLVWU_10000 [Bdellovibrio sp. HCB290]|uniref:hypothetical protein n=1 Tax=Bdellovibrio sp. HCB290 TaxID=3394356 RepID=UPI0039B4F4F8